MLFYSKQQFPNLNSFPTSTVSQPAAADSKDEVILASRLFMCNHGNRSYQDGVPKFGQTIYFAHLELYRAKLSETNWREDSNGLNTTPNSH